MNWPLKLQAGRKTVLSIISNFFCAPSIVVSVDQIGPHTPYFCCTNQSALVLMKVGFPVFHLILYLFSFYPAKKGPGVIRSNEICVTLLSNCLFSFLRGVFFGFSLRFQSLWFHHSAIFQTVLQRKNNCPCTRAYGFVPSLPASFERFRQLFGLFSIFFPDIV